MSKIEEKNPVSELISQGKKLTHYCPDWDLMLIHSEMPEIAACSCDFYHESDKILRDEVARSFNEQPPFSDDGSPARKPFLFPIKKQLNLEEAIQYLQLMDPAKGTLVFFTEDQSPTWINFGSPTRAEMVYALETVKFQELMLDLDGDDEHDEI